MPIENDGIMIILSSPSGAGKTTLVNLLSGLDNFEISVSLFPVRGKINHVGRHKKEENCLHPLCPVSRCPRRTSSARSAVDTRRGAASPGGRKPSGSCAQCGKSPKIPGTRTACPDIQPEKMRYAALISKAFFAIARNNDHLHIIFWAAKIGVSRRN